MDEKNNDCDLNKLNNDINDEQGDASFPLDRMFDKSTKDVCSGIQPQTQNDDKAEYNSDMSFPLDRPFESKTDNNEKKEGIYDLYNIRPVNAQNSSQGLHAEPKKKKKGGVWRILAIILVSILFGCALSVTVIIPVGQQLGFFDNNSGGTAQQNPQPNPNTNNNNKENNERPVHDYSNVEYPEELPNFDGEQVVIKNQYNPVPEIADQVSDCVVGISSMITDSEGNASGSRGTGVIISSEGYIVTNEHVTRNGGDITVTLNDGTEYLGTLMGVDESIDIAVIKIEAKGLSAIKIGNSSETMVGERAIAIGNPKGAGTNLTGTVTVGYISAVNREILFNDTRQKFIQTDAALNPGNSGGPLVNEKGEVIGIVTLKSLVSTVEVDGTSINAEGIGFAIPIDTAMNSVKNIILGGDVKRPGLGVKIMEINEEYAKEMGIHKGLYIDSFIEGSLGEKAGLKQGDIIIACEGEEVETLSQFQAILGGKFVGDSIQITVWRDGEEIDFNIVLSDMNKIG